VITVEFGLKPGAMAAFRKLMDENAIASCRDEPGCRRFDVLVPKGSDERIFLYEIYDDRAAFEAHVKTPHFKSFDMASAALIASKQVAEYDLVCEASET
jgi:(4S)-4-hydroxy-5-phosphonooxypentane-2,3-dione isomerase